MDGILSMRGQSTQRRTRLALGVALAVAVIVPLSAPAAGAESPASLPSSSVSLDSAAATAQLTNAGRWLTDSRGRVVVVHGVNVPMKALPAYPAALNFGDDDATLLTRLGINAVRLTVERYAVEPKAGTFDAGYVAQFASTIQMLARHGIMSLIDFHQDDFGPVFWDNGYPDWMTVTDGLPNLFFSPYPSQLFDNPALNRAFDHLWANDPGPDGRALQADDASLLAYVARALRSQPGLLGYEIINEPWPGTTYAECVQPTGCPAFDQGALTAYYQRIAPAIRAADTTHFIWYEPLTTFNEGVPTYVTPPDVSNRGFAFHDYNLCGSSDDIGSGAGTNLPADAATLCRSEDAMVLANAEAHSAATGVPLLETEFGATMNPSSVTTLTNEYDQNMISWFWWSYTRYVVKLTSTSALLPATDDNVNWPIADALARPYPQLVSGTPTSWNFDPASGTFTMRYSILRANGKGFFPPGSVTQIAIPALQYPAGYGVTIWGGRVTSPANSGLLSVASCPGFGSLSVTVAQQSRPAQTSC